MRMKVIRLKVEGYKIRVKVVSLSLGQVTCNGRMGTES
jgi:hypothetical protein